MTFVSPLPRYVVLDKAVGQTPLECVEKWRETHGLAKDVPLAYAGRLDPMASGTLLVLIGEECKRQTRYHELDKEYTFKVLLGIASDTADVLGLVQETLPIPPPPTHAVLTPIVNSLIGSITLPYPAFSAKTVQGKPLHVWTLENRLHEITIPVKTSRIFRITINHTTTIARSQLCDEAQKLIELPEPVTDARKALGNDFRRPNVRAAWQKIADDGNKDDLFPIITFTAIASSGTYMRTLAEVIAQKLGTKGIAFSIHRTKIGRYQPLLKRWGFWQKIYRAESSATFLR